MEETAPGPFSLHDWGPGRNWDSPGHPDVSGRDGLAFVGDYAVVGLSRPRQDKTFGGLALETELAKRGADARCGLLVIDLRGGDVVHWLRVEDMVHELYDVAVLPGVCQPMVLGF